ncbi:TetR/AcrR family transcriptional regulator [Amycolatopsis acidicola]|uniref:TetR/AcrR family transcriptional regulator n=1 Tax=Amycolatopsis acidicola TaxID=2596893 RepID=A0A5N0V3Y8_9PSEU|nr:TetR/AcrR family transcriptional regulator [Amycolatopsis acidicola]KAA9160504.1 TetR/AcrR family transcriptional regulator [Amycolatopsis acidicola]
MPPRKETTRSGEGRAAAAAAQSRPRGRPRKEIDLDEVADAAATLFLEGGYDAVSIEAAAEKLAVSRATLYRTVPTKEDLLGILFERSTSELYETARALVARTSDPAEALCGLIRVHVSAAIKMRRYLAVFFGGAGLPPEVYARWQRWSRNYERLWLKVVRQAMKAGVLEPGEPKVTTRLLLGMVIWVSRWYRPADRISEDEIAEAAIRLVGSRLHDGGLSMSAGPGGQAS